MGLILRFFLCGMGMAFFFFDATLRATTEPKGPNFGFSTSLNRTEFTRKTGVLKLNWMKPPLRFGWPALFFSRTIKAGNPAMDAFLAADCVTLPEFPITVSSVVAFLDEPTGNRPPITRIPVASFVGGLFPTLNRLKSTTKFLRSPLHEGEASIRKSRLASTEIAPKANASTDGGSMEQQQQPTTTLLTRLCSVVGSSCQPAVRRGNGARFNYERFIMYGFGSMGATLFLDKPSVVNKPSN